ncbi:MAG: hypothetical protein HN742_30435 [Lentisphaerae bacterium]|nr:hypothetical protein [Lentisphaerota bacterium]MBT7846230.1 hypothetical protein [Lentisphaerota bacterium]
MCRGGDPPDWPWEEQYVCPNGTYLVTWGGNNWTGMHVDDIGTRGRHMGFVADAGEGWRVTVDHYMCYTFRTTANLPCTGIYPPAAMSLTWEAPCRGPYGLSISCVLP